MRDYEESLVDTYDKKANTSTIEDDFDWEEGTPIKLKSYSITEIETKLGLAIDELIGKGADTIANIDSINFSDGIDSKVNINITFFKKVGCDF